MSFKCVASSQASGVRCRSSPLMTCARSLSCDEWAQYGISHDDCGNRIVSTAAARVSSPAALCNAADTASPGTSPVLPHHLIIVELVYFVTAVIPRTAELARCRQRLARGPPLVYSASRPRHKERRLLQLRLQGRGKQQLGLIVASIDAGRGLSPAQAPLAERCSNVWWGGSQPLQPRKSIFVRSESDVQRGGRSKACCRPHFESVSHDRGHGCDHQTGAGGRKPVAGALAVLADASVVGFSGAGAFWAAGLMERKVV